VNDTAITFVFAATILFSFPSRGSTHVGLAKKFISTILPIKTRLLGNCNSGKTDTIDFNELYQTLVESCNQPRE